MKKTLTIVLMILGANTWAETLFEEANPGSLSYRTVYYPEGIDFSINSSVVSDGSRVCGRYSLNLNALPSDSRSRWEGGYTRVLSITELPWYWQLKFDFYSTNNEPVKVEFLFERPGSYPWNADAYTFWVDHNGTGWETFIIDSSQAFSHSLGVFTGSTGTARLHIGKTSHDAYGNPLVASQLGSHVFKLDNVRLIATEIPEISCSLNPNEPMSISYIGTLQYSSDMENWTTKTPQPESPFVLTPFANKMFFRSIRE